MVNVIGLKELLENVDSYVAQIRRGKSFLVVRRSKPLFRVSPPEEVEVWEPVVDFTKIRAGGVLLEKILSRM